MKTRDILAAGDSAMVTDMGGRLAALGYTVTGTASSAEEASRLAEKLKPGIVLLGVGADADPVVACETIRQATDAPIVLVMCASPEHAPPPSLENIPDHGLTEILDRALKADTAGVLIEPFWTSQLLATLESARRARSEKEKLVLEYELGVNKTELERQNEELRNTRDHLEFLRDKYVQLYDFAPAGYMTITRQGIVAEANLTACSMAGVERSRMIGSAFSRFLEGGSRPAWYDHLADVFENGGRQECELAILPGRGSIVDIQAVSSAMEGPDGTTACLTALTDISALKRAERSLRASEAFNQRIIESSPDAIMIVDLNGKLVFVSAGVKTLMEVENEAVFLNSDFVGPWWGEDRIKAEKAFETAWGGRTAIFEGFCPTAKGKDKWWEVTVSPLYDDVNTVERFLVISRDVTQRRRDQEALRQAKDAAESANRAKSDFLARMSHEIRTPMNGVLGLAELLRVTETLSPTARNYLELLQQSGRLLLDIVNDILNFSRIEAGRAELEITPFSPRELLESTLAPLAVTAREKGLELTGSVSPDVPDVLAGDPVKVRQVLTNLVGNALKFTHQGGVGVTVTLDAPPASGSACLRFRVTDTGIGIPADKLETIFEAFSQAENSTNVNYGGTGLGLAIVKSLVTLMRGDVRVESTPGQGSSFTVAVPFILAQDEPAVRDDKHAPPRVSDGKKLRVLWADDNRLNQLVGANFLEELGHEAVVVENGLQALEKLKSEKFDAVFLDVAMPGMDGLEAVRAIRRGEAGRRNARLPVVAVTAHALKADRERSLDAGMDDYIAKPFSMDELGRILARVLTPRKARKA